MSHEEEERGVEGVERGKIIPIEWLRALQSSKPQDAKPAVTGADATDKASLLEEAKQELNELPDVRQEKIDEAKLRISTGYYDSPEVKKEILRSVLQNFLPVSRDPEDPNAGSDS